MLEQRVKKGQRIFKHVSRAFCSLLTTSPWERGLSTVDTSHCVDIDPACTKRLVRATPSVPGNLICAAAGAEDKVQAPSGRELVTPTDPADTDDSGEKDNGGIRIAVTVDV